MSLTTCCPHCQTRFRIVPDQLRISQGWVRCGHCQQLFDARESLQEVPQTQPATTGDLPETPAISEPSADPAPQSATPEPLPVEPLPEPELTAELAPKPEQIPAPAAQPLSSPEPQSATSAQNDISSARGLDEEDAQTSPVDAPAQPSVAEIAAQLGLTLDLSDETSIAPKTEAHAENPEIPEENPNPNTENYSENITVENPEEKPQENPTQTSAEGEGEKSNVADLFFSSPTDNLAENPNTATDLAPDFTNEHTPQFIRKAQRQARWTGPKVRFAMGMAAILLPLILLLQIAWHERTRLGAWQPALRPALQVMCVTLGCTMGPWRQLDAVVIVGSSFTQMDDAAHATQNPTQTPAATHAASIHFQLGLSLRNLSRLPVATPMLELTLTDPNEAIILRRVIDLSALQFPDELPAQSELNRSATLAVQGLGAGQTVAGYHLILFYP